MKGLIYIIGTAAGYGLALWLSDKYIEGVTLSPQLTDIAIAAGILTLINLIIKPILKLVLSPVIILTLGLGIIAINAFTIWLLMYFVPDIITIAGLLPLLYVTIVTSLVNMATRRIF